MPSPTPSAARSSKRRDRFEGYDPKKAKRVYGGDPKFERPKILTVSNEPRYLYAPSGWNVLGGERTVLHVLRIDLQETDGPLTKDMARPKRREQ